MTSKVYLRSVARDGGRARHPRSPRHDGPDENAAEPGLTSADAPICIGGSSARTSGIRSDEQSGTRAPNQSVAVAPKPLSPVLQAVRLGSCPRAEPSFPEL